jgi:hypothetical protein
VPAAQKVKNIRLPDTLNSYLLLTLWRDRPSSLHPISLMKKPKQLQLFKPDLRVFGGQLLHGKRRRLRPLSTKEPIHLVMRSSWCGESGAMGVTSFLANRNKRPIYSMIQRTAKPSGSFVPGAECFIGGGITKTVVIM